MYTDFLSMIVPEHVHHLRGAGFTYDPIAGQWYQRRTAVPAETVQIFLVKVGKSLGKREPGTWATDILDTAYIEPELTFEAFRKARMVRNRNRRLAGKNIFAAWCDFCGLSAPEGEGELESYIARKSLRARRLYDAICATGFGQCSPRARVMGAVMRSVFFGWALRDRSAERVEAEIMEHLQAVGPEDVSVPEPDIREKSGREKYDDFLRNLLGDWKPSGPAYITSNPFLNPEPEEEDP